MTTQYARAGELSIAWQAIGDGPLDLLVIPGLASHVEAFHDLPGYTQLLQRLARFARVITFDKRGNGLSDRITDAPSLPERIDDIHAVLDAANVSRVAVLGISEGSTLAIKFAADHPERTRALALFGAFPRILAAPGYEAGLPPAAYEAFVDTMVKGWGTGVPLVTMFGPSLANAQQAAGRVERLTATPTALRMLFRMAASIDVRDSVPRITAPTVVIHRTGDRVIPAAAGRWIAAHVPGGKLVELPGDDHFPFAGDTAPIIDAIATLVDAPMATCATTAPPVVDALDATALDQLVAGKPVGRFVVTRPLGAGGMGQVFVAEDRESGREVAIKVMRRGDADAYRRFRREALAIAALSHPSVVQVYELGLDASVPYIVMEYVPGGTAAELPAQPWRRAVALVSSAARGLGAAHAVGIVHRDVKPLNLFLVDRTGDRLKVGDFGIAKLAGAEPLTRDGAMIGTVGYLAPEQAVGEPLDARADVWALGATLYRLLAGENALTGTAAEIIAHTLLDGLPAPAGIPDPVATLVRRLGARDPAARPLDGNAAADELDGLL